MARLVEGYTKEIWKIKDSFEELYSSTGVETVNNEFAAELDRMLRKKFPDSRSYILKDLMDVIRIYY